MIVSSLYSGVHLTGPKPRCFTTSGSTKTSAADVEAAVRAVARRGPGRDRIRGRPQPAFRRSRAARSPLAGKPARSPLAGKPARSPRAGKPARSPLAGKPARSPLVVPVSAAIYLFLVVTLEL